MKTIRPARQDRASDPTYPSLGQELEQRGLTRRGFLAAAFAAGAGAATGCMGTAPRPRYLRGRWYTVRITFTRPICLSGCAGHAERETFGAVNVSSPNVEFVRRLRRAAATEAFRARLTTRAVSATCRNSRLGLFTDRVQHVLVKELHAWYQGAVSFTLRRGEVTAVLQPARQVAR